MRKGGPKIVDLHFAATWSNLNISFVSDEIYDNIRFVRAVIFCTLLLFSAISIKRLCVNGIYHSFKSDILSDGDLS